MPLQIEAEKNGFHQSMKVGLGPKVGHTSTLQSTKSQKRSSVRAGGSQQSKQKTSVIIKNGE